MKFLFVVLAASLLVASANAGWFDDALQWSKNAGSTVKDTVVEKGGDAVEWSKQAGESAGQWAKEAGGKVVDTAKDITLDDIVNGAKTAGSKVGEAANDVYKKVAGHDDQHTIIEE